jgi:phage virion morphogenesis protein
MAGVEIIVQGDSDVLSRINNLINFDKRNMLDEIGQYVVSETAHRFRTSTAPDGAAWAPISALTLSRRTHPGKNKPLDDFGNLRNSITYRVNSDDVSVGTNMVYAAVQQFGAKKGAFGRYSQVSRYRNYGEKDFRRYAGTKKGFPIPWNDIPARPFLGLSKDDKDEVLNITRQHIEQLIGGVS